MVDRKAFYLLYFLQHLVMQEHMNLECITLQHGLTWAITGTSNMGLYVYLLLISVGC